MKLINCTMHPINIKHSNGETTIIPGTGAGNDARVQMVEESIAEYDGFQFRSLTPGKVYNLPDPQEDTLYIVGMITFLQLKGIRNDLVCPDTDRAEKNEKGHILSVPGFSRYN